MLIFLCHGDSFFEYEFYLILFSPDNWLGLQWQIFHLKWQLMKNNLLLVIYAFLFYFFYLCLYYAFIYAFFIYAFIYDYLCL